MRFLLSLAFSLSIACFGASRPPILGKDAMVVSAHHLASEIGEKMLSKGGNAIDAAVAMGYALAVVHPCCGNIGGGGFMLIRFHDGRTTFINFREKAPLAFQQQLYDQGHHKSRPFLNVGVPGTVMGLNTALEKYGKLPLATVMAPAIHLAKNGFTLTPQGAKILQLGEKTIRAHQNSRRIFTRNDTLLRSGDPLVQTQLGKTLSTIAQGGSKAFYEGNIAQQIVQASKAQHGLLTPVDFAQYTTNELPPITCDYRGYHIITAPPPSAGGVTICQTLNTLEHTPLADLGYHSAAATHYMVEAMRYTFADRNQFLGDPNFVNNPTQRLIDKAHAKKIYDKIDPQKATDSRKIGMQTNVNDRPNTTGYVVVDQQGNAVAVTYTLNRYFGAGVMAKDTGFFLNDEMDDFNLQPGKPNMYGLIQGKANMAEPGKRPLSSMSPTIITKDNQLFMVLSTPGGSTIPTQLINVITNVIDFGMNIQEAVDAPRFHMQWLPDKIFFEPMTFSADTMHLLGQMGHQFQLGSPWGIRFWGAVMAIQADQKTRRLHGAADPRRPSAAALGF